MTRNILCYSSLPFIKQKYLWKWLNFRSGNSTLKVVIVGKLRQKLYKAERCVYIYVKKHSSNPFPELLKVLAEMGHGDTLVIGDANFAAASMAKNSVLVRCDGLKATDLMEAILTLMPLDDFVDQPVKIMDKEPRHADLECPVWDEFKEIVARHDPRGADACGMISRKDFYKEAKEAYAVIATTETAFYACTILQKGCL